MRFLRDIIMHACIIIICCCLFQLHTELVKKELEVADLQHKLGATKEDLDRRRRVCMYVHLCVIGVFHFSTHGVCFSLCLAKRGKYEV